MNETDSSEADIDRREKEQKEFRRLMWDCLTIEERIVMTAYKNNNTNNKPIHPRLMNAVNSIHERYPDFDMTCVP